MNKNRPVNLELTSLKYPPMAIVSILHRISGVLIFLLLPVILYIVAMSLKSEAFFNDTQALISHPVYKLILWGFASALAYHLIAGLRHMVMDLGFGEHLQCARTSAITTIVLALIATILLGLWIW